MSHITVHRRGKLRTGEIGRVAQILALPPQPARHDGKHWDFTRRGFAHGFFLGRYDERTGKTDPIVAAAREAALAAGVDPALVEQIDIDDLLVTPEFISGSVGGINFRTPRMRSAAKFTTPTDRYEATEYGGTASMSVNDLIMAGSAEHNVSTPVPGPIILVSCVLTGNNDTFPTRHALTLEGHGLLAHFLSEGGSPFESPGATRLDFLSERPTTLTMTINNRGTGTNTVFGTALLAYRHARKIE